MGRKFTILGDTNSGKTCYLLAIYAAMAGGFEGYTIRAQQPEMHAKLLGDYKLLANKKLDHQNRFPTASFEVEEYSFNLGYANETFLPFKWIDYPGGNLVLTDTIDREQYEQVAQNIQESSVLFICIDGELLADKDDDTEDKIDNIRPISMTVNPYFNDYIDSGKKMPPVGFIITKYDLCCETTTPEELKKIIKEAFSPFFVKRENQIGIIPVSLGQNIADDNYHGKLRPQNVHLPIFMGIYFALCDEIKKNKSYRELISRNEQDIRNRKDKISSGQRELLDLKERISALRRRKATEEDHFFDFMKDKALIESLSNSIAVALEQVDKIEAEIAANQSKIRSNESENERTQKLIGNVRATEDMFDKFLNRIMWFFDGAWQTSFRS